MRVDKLIEELKKLQKEYGNIDVELADQKDYAFEITKVSFSKGGLLGNIYLDFENVK